MAAYYEERVFPLTTNTNCYTAYTDNARFCTQRHACWIVSSSDDDDRAQAVQWEELPANRLCVGYTSVSPWEAMALLHDQWQQQQQPDDDAPAKPTSSTVDPTTSSAHPIATNMETTTTSDAGIQSRSRSLIGPVHLPKDIDYSSNNSMPELSLEALQDPPTTTAEIIVRRIMVDDSYTIPVSYRPVALHLMLLGDSPLLWTGSADHSKLYSYGLQMGEFQLRHDEEFPASVLAIASNHHTLIVASQDGSIVTLKYEANGVLTKQATVIIDGPILALRYRDNIVTIGSLCGYVAQMNQDGSLSMVVEGLVTAHNAKQEDAVLAVESTTNDRIWVGMRSGRCMAYRRDKDEWILDWQISLPYAINGILQDTTRDRTIVTTTRGVHIFRSIENAVRQARERLTSLQSND